MDSFSLVALSLLKDQQTIAAIKRRAYLLEEKMKIFLIYAMLMAVFTGSSAFGAGRVNAPADPAKRCMNAGVGPDLCESYRKRALAAGCIDQQEYEALRNFGAYPSCNALKGEGLAQLDGWCPCGCFHPNTMISSVFKQNGREVDVAAVIVAKNRKEFDLVNLDGSANFSNFSLSQAPITISTAGVEKRPLVIITTADNRILSITEKHPVLLHSGRMVQALSLKKTDLLVSKDGSPVAIKRIDRKKFKGEVVNFSTQSESKNGHVIFAEGLAVGDLFWQSGLEDEMNQVFIRR